MKVWISALASLDPLLPTGMSMRCRWWFLWYGSSGCKSAEPWGCGSLAEGLWVVACKPVMTGVCRGSSSGWQISLKPIFWLSNMSDLTVQRFPGLPNVQFCGVHPRSAISCMCVWVVVGLGILCPRWLGYCVGVLYIVECRLGREISSSGIQVYWVCCFPWISFEIPLDSAAFVSIRSTACLRQ